mgnify:CR=1 FL=1
MLTMILPAKIKFVGTMICPAPFSFFSSNCLLYLDPIQTNNNNVNLVDKSQ